MVNVKKLNRAIIFEKNKDFKSSELIYAELLKEYPNDETLLSFWGMYNFKINKLTKAEKILERAYNIKKSPSTIAGLAYTKFKLKKYDDAIILYEELFRYDKDSEHIYQKIIECFDKLYMYNFAEAYCKKYLSVYPNNLKALALTTQIYMNMKDYQKAEEFCSKTIELYPEYAQSWVNAGLIQELYGNEEMAQECYKTAISNHLPSAYYHLAVSLHKTGNDTDAEKCFKKFFEIFPNEVETKGSLGHLYFSHKDFYNGYKYYIHRTKPSEINLLNNLWNGENNTINFSDYNKILVFADQGLGDGVMFSRYLPFLKEKYEEVVVYVREPLYELLKNTYPEIEFAYENLENIEHEISILLADVPYFLDMDFDNIPKLNLKVNDAKVSEYKNTYFNNDKLKVGLCWRAGNLSIRAAINRTINIDYFKDILDLDHIQFYSFQKEDIFNAIEKYPQIIDLSKTFDNLDDTAAALKNLDLLLTVDTVVAHVSGGLGIKTKLLIPYSSDWRWFQNDEKTEWYPNVEILKQQDRVDWFIETDKIKKDLCK